MKKNRRPPVAPDTATERYTFLDHVWKNKAHRKLLLVTLLVNALAWVVYKYGYPLGDYYSDSQGYVLSAVKNQEVFYRPPGYKRFLTLFHAWNSSELFTLSIHFFSVVISTLFLFFSIDYLLGFKNKYLKYGSWAFGCLVFWALPLSNMVGTDALFTSLTLAWFATLLWIHKKGSWWALGLQILLIYGAFILRYNALYYPLVATVVLLFSARKNWVYKIGGIGMSAFILFMTYTNIRNETFKMTNAPVFSGFSGWQLANNALYMYKHIEVDSNSFSDPEVKAVNTCAALFIDSIAEADRTLLAKGKIPGSVFMWDPGGPLKQYNYRYMDAYKLGYIRSWYQVSIPFSQFAIQLIKDHPWAYFKHFILKNTAYFFVPDKEFMARYNFMGTELAPEVRTWFGLKGSDTLKPRTKGVQEAIVNIYYVFYPICILLSLLAPVLYLFNRKKGDSGADKGLLILWAVFFLATMGFSITAAPITFRNVLLLVPLALGLPMWFLDQALSARRLKKA